MLYISKKHKYTVYLSLLVSILLSLVAVVLFSAPLLYVLSNRGLFLACLIIISLVLFCGIFYFLTYKYWRIRKKIIKEFPPGWEVILQEKVNYYNSLKENERPRFKNEIMRFLEEVKISGVDTDVDAETKVLIAASAVIPVFNFQDWEYHTLDEILVYPDNFSDCDFSFTSDTANTAGFVLSRGGIMILSKPSLFQGFAKMRDGHNVGIHEFAHKIDGEDGIIDGIPELLLDKSAREGWQRIIEHESQEIRKGRSDINSYALKNSAEFFAVTSEYFFEKPGEMSQKHPELYDVLMKIYRQDTKSMLKYALKSMIGLKSNKIGRNSPCPCGSGLKYKKCCLDKITS